MPEKKPSKKSVALEEAELRKAKAEAEKAELDVETARHDLAWKIRQNERSQRREKELDLWDERRTVFFDGGVSAVSCRTVLSTLTEWSIEDPGCDMEIIISSPGGSVFDGLAFGDALEGFSRKGHHVTVTVAGMAASMAGVILQFADHRVIGRNSYLHLHEVSTGAIGKASDLMDTAELAKRLTRQSAEIYARRARRSADEIFDMMHRQEVWLTAEQALDLGFVDEIR